MFLVSSSPMMIVSSGIGVGCGIACLLEWYLRCIHVKLRDVVFVMRIQGCLGGVVRHTLALEGRRLCLVYLSRAQLVRLFEVDRLTGVRFFLPVMCVGAHNLKGQSTSDLVGRLQHWTLSSFFPWRLFRPLGLSLPPDLGSPGAWRAAPGMPSRRGAGRRHVHQLAK